MKIIYLKQAIEDLEWFYYYYTDVFPAGKNNAQKHYLAIEIVLQNNPLSGRKVSSKLRIFPIPKTPFSFIYHINDQKNIIELARVWDNRRGDKGKIYE